MRLRASSLPSSLLVLALLTPGSGCHGPASLPVPPIQTARPPAIPQPVTPADKELLGYLRVRDPARLSAEIGEDKARKALGRGGLQLTDLRPGAPVAFFAWAAPNRALAMPQTAGLFPLVAQSQSAAALAERQGAAQPYKDQLLVAANGEALARAAGQGDDLLALAGANVPWDAHLYLHTESLLGIYGAQARAGLALLPAAMAAQARATGPSPEATVGMLSKLLDQLEKMKSLSLGLAFLPEDIEVDAVTEERKARPAPAIAAPDLGQLLPPAQMRMQWNMVDASRSMGALLDIYTPMVQEIPGLLEQLRALVVDFGKVGHMSFAMSMSMGGAGAAGSGMRGAGLALADDAEAYMKLARRMMETLNRPEILAAYRKLGVDLSITLKPAVRVVMGWPVDQYVYRFSLTKDALPAQRMNQALLESMDGSVTEVTRIGRYVLFSIGQPLEPLIERVRSRQSQPLAAARAFPPGGTMYLDLDMAQLLGGVRSLLPPAIAGKVPELPAELAPVTVAAYDNGPDGYYRMRLPRAVLRGLAP